MKRKYKLRKHNNSNNNNTDKNKKTKALLDVEESELYSEINIKAKKKQYK